jgi:hypothetical protein
VPPRDKQQRGQRDAPLHRGNPAKTANRAASIRARLQQYLHAAKPDFNLRLTQYGLEFLL